MIARPETYRFSVEEYHKLGEVGIFEKHDRVELLDGEIVIMAPIGRHHTNSVRRILNRLVKLFGNLCLVDCQSAFILDDFQSLNPISYSYEPKLTKATTSLDRRMFS